MGFQSTRPVQGATSTIFSLIRPSKFQSTRPVQGATSASNSYYDTQSISIHAPRAGRDYTGFQRSEGYRHFNPRAPCRARRKLLIINLLFNNFNPRAPCRARLAPAFRRGTPERFQSTRPVQGATPVSGQPRARQGISIHAPRAGRDILEYIPAARALKFQSTRPVQGATGWRTGTPLLQGISIHAPRAGRDDC